MEKYASVDAFVADIRAMKKAIADCSNTWVTLSEIGSDHAMVVAREYLNIVEKRYMTLSKIENDMLSTHSVCDISMLTYDQIEKYALRKYLIFAPKQD